MNSSLRKKTNKTIHLNVFLRIQLPSFKMTQDGKELSENHQHQKKILLFHKHRKQWLLMRYNNEYLSADGEYKKIGMSNLLVQECPYIYFSLYGEFKAWWQLIESRWCLIYQTVWNKWTKKYFLMHYLHFDIFPYTLLPRNSFKEWTTGRASSWAESLLADQTTFPLGRIK